MKKILVFGMTDNPGGVESVIMNYYRHINRDEIQFDFLCNCCRIAYEKEIRDLGGNIYKITARKENYWKFKKELKTFMKHNASQYDVLWVNLCSLVNIDYLIQAKKYGIKKRIIHCHNSENDAGIIKGAVHAFNKKRIAKLATDFWSCSEEASPWFFSQKIIAGKNYRIIPNAIDVEKFKKNISIRESLRKEFGFEGKKVIGHVGRFHFQKNHKFLLEIFSELVKKSDDYRLLLVGQGELESKIRQIAKRKKVLDKVKFCGVREDVEKIYQAMDLFVLPSVSEGLGIVALEAQANLLPCLIADTVPHIVKVNDNVIFLSLNENATTWANCIEKMMKNDILIENKMVTSEYNIEVQVKKFEESLFE